MKSQKRKTHTDEVYEVESIIKSRKINGKVQYFVKWKGYPKSECTWEPETNLAGAQRILKEFKL